MFVIMREEFRLVRGHINIHRAIGLASFASEAKIERVLHAFVAPAIFSQGIVVEHFP